MNTDLTVVIPVRLDALVHLIEAAALLFIAAVLVLAIVLWVAFHEDKASQREKDE